MRKVIGLVDLHHDISLDFLTETRSIASTQFLGRYCFIDMPLSNFSNSGIKKIGILIKEKPRSLFRHLGLKNPWAFNTKTGGIEYVYWAKDKNGETVRVRAYDYDGDGNIDAYKQRCGCDSPSDGTWATYVNPKDDGTDNFKKQEAFNLFDPSTWFK